MHVFTICDDGTYDISIYYGLFCTGTLTFDLFRCLQSVSTTNNKRYLAIYKTCWRDWSIDMYSY